MGYAAQIALAKKLLGKKGRSLVLTRAGQGSIDAIAGTRADGGDKTAVFFAVGLPPGKSADKEIGTLVNRNIVEFYMARVSGSIDPQPGDMLPWNGKTYTVIYATSYDPDGSGQTIMTKAYGEAGG